LETHFGNELIEAVMEKNGIIAVVEAVVDGLAEHRHVHVGVHDLLGHARHHPWWFKKKEVI
jgi:hypothetical protein